MNLIMTEVELHLVAIVEEIPTRGWPLVLLPEVLWSSFIVK